MTSAEFSEWIAFDMYHHPIGNEWRQTGVLAAAVLAPHSKRGKMPKAEDFVPVAKLPQTEEQMAAELAKLKSLAGGE